MNKKNEQDPFQLFDRWYRQALGQVSTDVGIMNYVAQKILFLMRYFIAKLFRSATLFQPEACSLATVNSLGRPSSRMVLFKGVVDQGFSFYTNKMSQKGSDLKGCPFAAMTFYWPFPPRQIRIEGKVIEMNAERSDAYWNSRPRGAQLSALVSQQSHAIESRKELVRLRDEAEEKYSGKKVPRPEHWGGYLVIPDKIEFWEGKANRFHKRQVFVKSENQWNQTLLAP